jgi:hypothetical protein
LPLGGGVRRKGGDREPRQFTQSGEEKRRYVSDNLRDASVPTDAVCPCERAPLTTSLRLLVASAAGCFALAFAATAFAAYEPALVVAGTSHTTGGGGTVFMGFTDYQRVDDLEEASGMITLYSPRGYRVRLGQRHGAPLGALTADIHFTRPLETTTDGLRFRGTLRADNPAAYVANTCSPGLHDAVWTIEDQRVDESTTVGLVIYVDRVTSGPESAFASARMRICLPSPFLPRPFGLPAGGWLHTVVFSVQGVFRNPNTRGSYAWNGVFVPYMAGTAALDQAKAVQSTSFVRLPARLAMTAKRQKRGKRTFAVVTACLSESGHGIRGMRVYILAGRSARHLRFMFDWRRYVYVYKRTNARGCASIRMRVTKPVLFVRASLAPMPMDRDFSPPGPPYFRELTAYPHRPSSCQPKIMPRCSEPSIAPTFGLRSRNTARIRQ